MPDFFFFGKSQTLPPTFRNFLKFIFITTFSSFVHFAPLGLSVHNNKMGLESKYKTAFVLMKTAKPSKKLAFIKEDDKEKKDDENMFQIKQITRCDEKSRCFL